MSEFLMQVWWLIPACVITVSYFIFVISNRIVRAQRRRIDEHRAAQESMGSNPINRTGLTPITPSQYAQYHLTTTGTSTGGTNIGIRTPGYQPAAPDLGEPEDFEGEFKGWRSYTIHMADRGKILLVGVRQAWESGELVAECGSPEHWVADGGTPAHCVSHLWAGRCSCGIYMMKALDRHSVIEALADWKTVLAQCSASGVVVEHEHGFRAERVRIDRLFVDDTCDPVLLDSLRTRYGCPVLSLQEHATPLLTGRLT